MFVDSFDSIQWDREIFGKTIDSYSKPWIITSNGWDSKYFNIPINNNGGRNRSELYTVQFQVLGKWLIEFHSTLEHWINTIEMQMCIFFTWFASIQYMRLFVSFDRFRPFSSKVSSFLRTEWITIKINGTKKIENVFEGEGHHCDHWIDVAILNTKLINDFQYRKLLKLDLRKSVA